MLVHTFVSLFSLISLASAQLSGKVGPLTSYASKASKKVCDVTDYGAVADGSTDLGPALTAAWNACKTGGLIYIPPGNFAMSTWASLSGGSATAIQLDGVIIRNSDNGGNMISISHTTDFEFFSGTSKGAWQGYGYKLIQNGTFGPRLLRLTSVTDFSVHGFALVDSASYYIVFDTCTNGEVYNLILRGISIGETDGIDLWGTNVWIHDVEVTNGDECVTVKSPAKNVLISSIYCNWSGGTAIGSLGTGTSISNVYYKNIYTSNADACYLKTNGGDGSVHDVTWDTVITRNGPYPLAINEAWGTDRGSTGVQLSNLYFTNWHGFNSANSRPLPRLECDPDVPCYNITLNNVNLWTASGNYVKWSCQNAYGTGACLHKDSGSRSTYTTVVTQSSAPVYSSATMASDLTAPFPSTKSFTIPPVPTSFYPGQKPSSALLNLSGPGGLAAKVARETARA